MVGQIAECEVLLERKLRLIRAYQSQLTVRDGDIVEEVLVGGRLAAAQGLLLYTDFELLLLSLLASYVRLRKNGLYAYYNRNVHIEPTNVCEFRCAFCSYRREGGEPDAWLLGGSDIARAAEAAYLGGKTEIHITGGAYPQWELSDLIAIVREVRRAAPSVHIKAFSAVELVAVFEREHIDYAEGVRSLQANGLDSIPGGGAEIFNPEIREKICPGKASAEQWLSLHRAAHSVGMNTNATMLYGHIESYADRLEHLGKLRELQDEFMGFNCFIPLKFRAGNNCMSGVGEIELEEVLRNYAVCRIFLDNIPHLKAYWPMLGKRNIPLSLSYGADDLDGTVDDSTKIYSMAGAEEQNPAATVEELTSIIHRAGYIPVERDSLYRLVSPPSPGIE